ncbi:BsuPI-related putative proteinase inhibitor [Anaerobacillus sp. MEB173]|uniref:BsuPI-related putative proteinase inhibitor n=1 Tax=Anaerobacillus sp. MEB173 TaxID=3383345 RepID=UPI003F8DAC3D
MKLIMKRHFSLLLIFLISVFTIISCSVNPEIDQSENTEGEVMSVLNDLGDGTFEYKLTNLNEKEITFYFTSGQRFDYSVKTKDGKELFLFSSVASFIQETGKETLKQGEELAYTIDLKDLHLDKGEYILEVWLTSTEEEDCRIAMDYNVY